MGVLDGVRVLDFGRYIAGPYCAALLGDLGAEVIRVEKREGSEDRFVAPLAETGEGAMFFQMNRGKRSMTLDPMHAEGREIVRKLVKTADVVVANLPPPTLKQMGLDYDSLAASKPDIILTTASAFGDGGPYSSRVGFDGIGQVMAGGTYMTGTEDQPYRAAVPFVDFTTAVHCAFGTLAALMHRAKGGGGQIVEGQLLGSALTLNNALLMEQAVLDRNRVPTGNRGQTSAPNDLFQAKDGWMLVQIVGQPLYERWARLMGEPHWLTDPRFKDDLARGDNGHLISARTQEWCRNLTRAEALAALEKARIPAAPVLKPQETLDDPHVKAMGYLHPVEFPGLPRPAPVARPPIRLGRTPTRLPPPPPRLGADTEVILRDLGYARGDIDRLRQEGVV